MTDFSVRTANITTRTGKVLDVRDIILEYNLYESLNSNSIVGTFLIQDSNNLLEQYDIFGQEKFTLEIGNDSDSLVELELFIYSITARTMHQKKQTYTLKCYPRELLRNEHTRIFQRFENLKAEDILKIILNDYLKVTQERVIFDRSVYNINFVSPSWRCYDAISWLQQRTVPLKYKDTSAGYLFFETLDGNYNFRSIDILMEQKPKYSEPFVYTQGGTKRSKVDDETLRIRKFNSSKPFDLLTNSRIGLYSHTNMLFNVNERKLYSTVVTLDDYFENNVTLNEQRPYHASNDFDLVKKPSRVIFKPFLNDTWSDGSNTLNTDVINTNISRTVFRYNLFKTNSIEVEVKGNFDLRAGDVIDVLIPSPKPVESGTEPDNRFSGKYLIHSIRHCLHRKVDATTVMTLVRDSYSGESLNEPVVPNQENKYLGVGKDTNG